MEFARENWEDSEFGNNVKIIFGIIWDDYNNVEPRRLMISALKKEETVEVCWEKRIKTIYKIQQVFELIDNRINEITGDDVKLIPFLELKLEKVSED